MGVPTYAEFTREDAQPSTGPAQLQQQEWPNPDQSTAFFAEDVYAVTADDELLMSLVATIAPQVRQARSTRRRQDVLGPRVERLLRRVLRLSRENQRLRHMLAQNAYAQDVLCAKL